MFSMNLFKKRDIKLYYLSDLHLETHKEIPKILEQYYHVEGKPYLALLGDIGNPHSNIVFEFIEKLAPKYTKIFYIFGNHEYYCETYQNTYTIDQVKKIFREKLSKFKNVKILDNEIDYIEDYKIIGTTLWTHIKNEEFIEVRMNDYGFIYQNNKKTLRVKNTNELNRINREFIQRESNQKCIVLTHHAPLFSVKGNYYLCDPIYVGEPQEEAFHNDCSVLFNSNIRYWLFGHTHWTSFFKYKDTIVATNQSGHEYVNFKPLEFIYL